MRAPAESLNSSLQASDQVGGGGGGGGGEDALLPPDAQASVARSALAASAKRDREHEAARAGEDCDEETAMVVTAGGRQVPAAERHRLPPGERRAALVAHLNEAPSRIHPARGGGEQHEIVERRRGLAVPEEHDA